METVTKLYGYLIDPVEQTVTEVPYSGNYEEIYQYIGADAFDVARVNEHGDGIYVDDEGLINGKQQAFFQIQGYHQPLAGKGLYMGCDAEGETVAPYATLEEVKDSIRWVMPVKINDQLIWLEV